MNANKLCRSNGIYAAFCTAASQIQRCRNASSFRNVSNKVQVPRKRQCNVPQCIYENSWRILLEEVFTKIDIFFMKGSTFNKSQNIANNDQSRGIYGMAVYLF